MLAILAGPAVAQGAVSYPVSTGGDGALTLPPGTYNYDTATGLSIPAGAVPGGAVEGGRRVLNLTTIEHRRGRDAANRRSAGS